MKTTLNQIYAVCECDQGWNALLKYLGKTEPDDEPLSMTTIYNALGLMPAIWAIRTIEGAEREKKLFNIFLSSGASEADIKVKFLELFGD